MGPRKSVKRADGSTYVCGVKGETREIAVPFLSRPVSRPDNGALTEIQRERRYDGLAWSRGEPTIRLTVDPASLVETSVTDTNGTQYDRIVANEVESHGLLLPSGVYDQLAGKTAYAVSVRFKIAPGMVPGVAQKADKTWLAQVGRVNGNWEKAQVLLNLGHTGLFVNIEGAGDEQRRLHIRAGGDKSNPSDRWTGYVTDSASGSCVHIGAPYDLASFNVPVDTWMDFVLSVDGTTIRYKIWREMAEGRTSSLLKEGVLTPTAAAPYEPVPHPLAHFSVGHSFLPLMGDMFGTIPFPSDETGFGAAQCSSGRIEGFCGEVSRLAVWKRALSDSEMLAAAADARGANLFSLGLEDGLSGEFDGPSADGDVQANGDWSRFGSTLAAGGTKTVRFHARDWETTVGWHLKVRTTESSGAGRLAVSINGKSLEQEGVANCPIQLEGGARSAYVLVPAGLLAVGENVIVLTSDASSGEISFDAISMGGAFFLGYAEPTNYGEGCYWELSSAVFANLTESRDCYLGAGAWSGMEKVNVRAQSEGSVIRFRFNVPEDLAGREHWLLQWGEDVYAGAAASRSAWRINGNDLAELAHDAPRLFACERKVPARFLRAGENVLEWRNSGLGDEAPDVPKRDEGHFLYLDYLRLSPLRATRGGVFVIR